MSNQEINLLLTILFVVIILVALLFAFFWWKKQIKTTKIKNLMKLYFTYSPINKEFFISNHDSLEPSLKKIWPSPILYQDFLEEGLATENVISLRNWLKDATKNSISKLTSLGKTSVKLSWKLPSTKIFENNFSIMFYLTHKENENLYGFATITFGYQIDDEKELKQSILNFKPKKALKYQNPSEYFVSETKKGITNNIIMINYEKFLLEFPDFWYAYKIIDEINKKIIDFFTNKKLNLKPLFFPLSSQHLVVAIKSLEKNLDNEIVENVENIINKVLETNDSFVKSGIFFALLPNYKLNYNSDYEEGINYLQFAISKAINENRSYVICNKDLIMEQHKNNELTKTFLLNLNGNSEVTIDKKWIFSSDKQKKVGISYEVDVTLGKKILLQQDIINIVSLHEILKNKYLLKTKREIQIIKYSFDYLYKVGDYKSIIKSWQVGNKKTIISLHMSSGLNYSIQKVGAILNEISKRGYLTCFENLSIIPANIDFLLNSKPHFLVVDLEEVKDYKILLEKETILTAFNDILKTYNGNFIIKNPLTRQDLKNMKKFNVQYILFKENTLGQLK